MATRSLTLTHVSDALVRAIVDLAFDEDRDPQVQAERLLREALEKHGRWPRRDQTGSDGDAQRPTVNDLATTTTTGEA